MERDIDSTVKRGRAYWFADGFSELVLGIFCIVLGGAILLRGWAGQGGFLAGFGSAALDFSVLKAVCLLAAFLAIWWLKDRFTYPRTGYVRGRKIPPAVILILIRNILLVVLLPLLGAAAVLIFIPPARAVLAYLPAVSPAGIGLLWGIPCYAAGEWMGLRRFRLMGLVMILAGAAIGAWQMASGFPALSAEALEWDFFGPLPEALRGPLDDLFVRTLTGVGILTAVTGAGFIATGAAAFLRYRKENPEPYREEP